MKVRARFWYAVLLIIGAFVGSVVVQRLRYFDVVDPSKPQSFAIRDYFRLGTIITLRTNGALDGTAEFVISNKGGGVSLFAVQKLSSGTVDETLSFATSGSRQQIDFFPGSAKTGTLKIAYEWK